MRIVYFLRDITDCGGIQQTTCNITNALLEFDEVESIQIISLYHKYANVFFELNSSIERAALFDHVVDLRKAFFDIKKRLKGALASLNYDIIIVQGTLFSIYIPTSIWKNNNVIVCEHGHYDMGKLFGLHSFGKRIALKHAAAIVALTALDAKNYLSNRKRNNIITSIPNAPIMLNHVPSYNCASKTIVCCGTLDKLKRFDHAISAAKVLKENYPDWKLVIYGDGKEREYLQKLINNNSLNSVVMLQGYENNKTVIYNDKAFLLMTSKFEGFGMVLLEAMQFGLPLVSYDIKYGPKEIIKDNYNGLLVPDGNIQELTSTIEYLIEHPSVRFEYSCNCKSVINNYSIDRISKQWINLFNSILPNGD